MTQKKTKRLRSREWFDIPGDPSATALHIERYTNFGISAAELRSGKPVIGIAQTGSDLVPCNRSHLDHVKRVREGIRQSGGIAIEFPVHPVQESGKRPTAALDRNLQYLSLVEVLFGYPIDGVVLAIGCDKNPGLADGSGNPRSARHLSLRGPDAQRLLERGACRFRDHRLESSEIACGWRDR